MNFQYKARDPLGKTHAGTLEAFSREEAVQLLQRDGFQVLDVREEPAELTLLPRGIRKSEIIYVTNQLAIMVDTGITLAAALQGIAQQEANPRLRSLLLELKGRVESGEDFSSALARYPAYFDATFVAMIKASERTGALATMLDRVASYLRKELETRGKVRAALAYPAVMLVVAIAVTIFLLTFVLPKFEPLFSRQDVSLPTATVVMVALSASLTHYWYLWGLTAIGLSVGFVLGRRTPAGRRGLDRLKLSLPLVGPMFRKVALSRTIRTLGTMTQGGVSMLDAISLAAEVSGNQLYRQSWLRVLEQVTTGNRICDALRNDPLFPSTLVQMIGAGEEAGKLEYVLQKVSDYFDQEVESSLKTMTSLIEPILITVMGGVVGTIGLGLLLPIFSLSRAAGG